MRIKICGITQPVQGRSITELGATALGFMCVSASPRCVSPSQIQAIVEHLSTPLPDRIGVFADATLADIVETVQFANLNGVQLHGAESPEYCHHLRNALPGIELIKALRVKSAAMLVDLTAYQTCVDTLLLDAYHPNVLGGTGQTLDWLELQNFTPGLPWLLAGGLNPDNIQKALQLLQPDGIDLSSGVERSPGDKDLAKVAQLFERLRQR
jgi:phosphoribosylanthranilate isomerase